MPEQYHNTRVCPDHFISGAPSKLHDVNNPDWAPSLKVVYERVSKGSVSSRCERYERAAKRRRLRSTESMEKTSTEESENERMESNSEIGVTNHASALLHNCVTVQTDLSCDTIERDVTMLRCEIEELKRENETLKQAVKQLQSELEERKMNEGYFEDDDK